MKLALVAVALSFALVPALAQDPLGQAKALYASAAYEEALVVLDGLKNGSTPPVAFARVDEYRAYCLLALGRTREAESAFESSILADPFYQPGEAEASPATRRKFSEVRQRLLPAMIQQQYQAAKASFDSKEYAVAVPKFERLLVMLDEPGTSRDPLLRDVKTLATGFFELGKTALEASTAAPEKSAAASAAAPSPRPIPQRQPLVVKAVPIQQRIPAWPSGVPLPPPKRGSLLVSIDETGRVESAALLVSVHPIYDDILLTEARKWRYQPATRDGKPIKSDRTIEVNVQNRP
jgi:hypothetical protein